MLRLAREYGKFGPALCEPVRVVVRPVGVEPERLGTLSGVDCLLRLLEKDRAHGETQTFRPHGNPRMDSVSCSRNHEIAPGVGS